MSVDTLAVKLKTIVIHEMSSDENTSRPGATHYETSSGHQRALVPWFVKEDSRKNIVKLAKFCSVAFDFVTLNLMKCSDEMFCY